MADQTAKIADEVLLRAVRAGQIEIRPVPGGNPFVPTYEVAARRDLGLEFLGGGVLDQANKIWREIRDRKFKRNVKDPSKPRVVAVGDSWFHYPFGSDLLEWFVDQYAVKTLAAAGDVVSRMTSAREYAPHIGQVKPHFFMLSGGGNDLLGEGPDGERNIKNMVIDYDPDAPDGLTQAGLETIRWVVAQYETIRADLTRLGFSGKMVVHGYDYPSPSSPGPWLSKPLSQKGYVDDAHQVAILKRLVDAFRAEIRTWAQQHAEVIHADCVGLNGRGHQYWFNEIHPTMAGFRYRILPAFRTPMDASMRPAAVDLLQPEDLDAVA